jgi:hypothetical protein
MKKPDGGPAFGSFVKAGTVAVREGGLTMRDWFATFAPEPTQDQIKFFVEVDRAANPHGDTYEPTRRSVGEIVSHIRYAYADAMIAEREK